MVPLLPEHEAEVRTAQGRVGAMKKGTRSGRYYMQIIDILEETELEQINKLNSRDPAIFKFILNHNLFFLFFFKQNLSLFRKQCQSLFDWKS